MEVHQWGPAAKRQSVALFESSFFKSEGGSYFWTTSVSNQVFLYELSITSQNFTNPTTTNSCRHIHATQTRIPQNSVPPRIYSHHIRFIKVPRCRDTEAQILNMSQQLLSMKITCMPSNHSTIGVPAKRSTCDISLAGTCIKL